jgi:hypothetical protein
MGAVSCKMVYLRTRSRQRACHGGEKDRRPSRRASCVGHARSVSRRTSRELGRPSPDGRKTSPSTNLSQRAGRPTPSFYSLNRAAATYSRDAYGRAVVLGVELFRTDLNDQSNLKFAKARSRRNGGHVRFPDEATSYPGLPTPPFINLRRVFRILVYLLVIFLLYFNLFHKHSHSSFSSFPLTAIQAHIQGGQIPFVYQKKTLA